jgi:hypothetical protein
MPESPVARHTTIVGGYSAATAARGPEVIHNAHQDIQVSCVGEGGELIHFVCVDAARNSETGKGIKRGSVL